MSTIDVVGWFLPGVAFSLVLSVIGAPSVARALGTGRLVAGLLMLSFGVILSATVTPIHGTLDTVGLAGRSCDFSRIGLVPLADLLELSDASLNVVLFVPLGAALGMIPNPRRKLTLILVSVALPFAIEALQLSAPILSRGCESADVIDNLTGLALGLAGATVVRWLAQPSGSGPATRR